MRRRWAAVLAGTVVSILAFSFVAIAIVRVDEGDGVAAAASGVGAAVLVPVLVLVVGFVSRAESPWRTAALWSPIAIVAFVAVVLAAREPATGYVLATGLGAAFAMRSEAGVHHRSWRVWTAVGLAVYTKIVFVLSPGLAILAAPLLPVAGIAIIDSVAERSGRPGRGHRSAH